MPNLYSIPKLAVGLLTILLAGHPCSQIFGEQGSGKKIYTQHCSSCHGKNGEGVPGEFKRPLIGDKSIPQLTKYIDRWMPEEKPELVKGKDAEKVARFIYDKFYSPIAQTRNRPARIELSRLTVNQYRNSITDLIQHFRYTPSRTTQRGLVGQYYNDRTPGRKQKVKRNDSKVSFHVTPEQPVPEGINPNGFSARWQGSVHAPKTGVYDFIVKTDHGMKLWVNDLEIPLMDRWVKSGKNTYFKKSIFLLGGRSYPIQLDFSAYTQGVRNKKNNAKPVEAFIELWWKKPHGVEQPIPSEYLIPNRGAKLFVSKTSFPPDDSSTGFIRGSSISKAWAQSITSASIEASNHILDNLSELTRTRKSDKRFASKVKEFAKEFTARAFRRPLHEFENKLYIDKQFEKAPNLEIGLKRVIMMVLTSPRFLYLNQGKEKADPYEVASRLSFALWDSIPDRALLNAAQQNQLQTYQQVEAQAQRMLKDPRAKTKMKNFLHHWLEIGIRGELSKSKKQFPKFDDALASDLEDSLMKFVEGIVWSKSSNFQELFESQELYLNRRIAKFYGLEDPKTDGFKRVEVQGGQRVGLLTQPYILANLAYHDVSSPIHRGVFLVRNILGKVLHPPPEAFTPFPADLHPDLTTRQRIELQTQPDACRGCHEKINSLGFALESYDAVGRHRTKENGRPIDESGFYILPSGKQQNLKGAEALATFLRDHDEVQTSFITQVFHHLISQPIMAYGTDTPQALRQQFEEDKFNIQKLLAKIASLSALEGVTSFASPKGKSKKGPMAF